MKNILIVYTTNAGSTADVAEMVRQAIQNKEIQVEVRPLSEVKDLAPYDAIIIGTPMIIGWHRDAKKFLRAHRDELSHKLFACFLTAMSLTKTRETSIDGIPVQIDPGLAQEPHNPKWLSLNELVALPSNYVHPLLKSAFPAKPVGVGLFGGSLNLFTLKWPARIFVLLAMRARPGDIRNESFIRDWAVNLRSLLLKDWLT